MLFQTAGLLKEIEDIKTKLISIEVRILKSEKATKEDKKAVKEALDEYRKRQTIRFS
ncbi:MAG: hypothetical protein HY514_01465 [Candidatus Aenigmarchaeota archaeon]|nr:hypothetical protein [Candidatus Aenigmarchaeota archaeon]